MYKPINVILIHTITSVYKIIPKRKRLKIDIIAMLAYRLH